MNLHISPQRAIDEMLARPNLRLGIGEHVVDVGALRVATRPDLPRLTGKSVAVLIELVRQAGNTVTRDELLDRVWTGRFTTPDVLNQAIKELRRAFGDDGGPNGYIETIPKVGYRLVARVRMLEASDGAVFVATPMERSINDELGPDAGPETAQPAAQSRAAGSWRRLALAGAGVAAAVVVAALLVHAYLDIGTAVENTPMAWTVSGQRALTSDPGAERRPRLSPDGSRVAVGVFDPQTGFDRIVVRTLEPSQLVHLTPGPNEHEAQPAWSPDGARILYERLHGAGCTMHVVSSLGGVEREVGQCRRYFTNYYDWTPDGRGLITSDRGADGRQDLRLLVQDLDTGARKYLDYARAPLDQDLDAHYSPDGRRIAFRRGLAPYSDLHVMDADGRNARVLTHVASRIRGHAWTRDGGALVFASDLAGPMALYAVDVDSGALHALGISPAEYPDTARATDAVVYEIPRTRSALSSAVPNGAGTATPQAIATSTGNDSDPRISRRSDRIAFVSDRSGQYQVWIHDLASAATFALTDDADVAVTAPRWNRDGNALVAVENRAGRRRLVEIEVASRHRRVLSREGENVLLGAGGGGDDTYVWVAGTSGTDNELVRVRRPLGADETREVLAHAVGVLDYDAATASVWYAPITGGSVHRVPFDHGVPGLVSDRLPDGANNWRVVDGELWYIADVEQNSAKLHAFDPAGGEDRIVLAFDAIVRNLDFDVMPDRRTVLAVPFGTEDTDVGLFKLSRHRNVP